MPESFRAFYFSLSERLWFRPIFYCLLAMVGVLIAHFADRLPLNDVVPVIKVTTLNRLLSVLTGTMLPVATFAVASMVAAFHAASSTATPRAFKLLLRDDASQNALSLFIGAFIYGVVAQTAFDSGAFGDVGIFVLFLETLMVFASVIGMFVLWVDRIARLGRVGTTIRILEDATMRALDLRRLQPTLGAATARDDQGTIPDGMQIAANRTGFVQSVNIAKLQRYATEFELKILLSAPPGHFVGLDDPLIVVTAGDAAKLDADAVRSGFAIDRDRSFRQDPRYGLQVMAEIASRALSSSTNDPGTAVDVMSRFVRLFETCADTPEVEAPIYPDVSIAPITSSQMFFDAFAPIARDGAGNLEVGLRLQEALFILARRPQYRDAARRQAQRALGLARHALVLDEDIARIEELSQRV